MNSLHVIVRYALAILPLICISSSCKTDYSKTESIETGNTIPAILMPGKVSTGMHEHGAPVFSPSNDIFLWTISLNGQKIILQLKTNSSDDDSPEVVPFSGRYRDEYPVFSPDGNTVYFMSWRPDNPGDNPLPSFRHWKAEREDQQWKKPSLNNLFHNDLWAYSMSSSGTLFGWASFEKGRDDADIYFQNRTEKGYSEPINAGDSINSDAIDYCPYISADESFIVFGRMGLGELDGLYLSYKKSDGRWSKAKRLPEIINSGKAERFPSVSPDMKTLYFNRQDIAYLPASKTAKKYMDVVESWLKEPANGNIYYISTDKIY